MIIKILLLTAALALAVSASRAAPSPGHLALRRMGIVATLAVAMLAVLFPESVTHAAHWVGVGRGTDLVLYAFIVVGMLGWLSTYRRLSELDSRFAELVRAQAIADAARERAPAADEGRHG